MTTPTDFERGAKPDLRWVGAADLAAMIRQCQITARAALEAMIERIETLNPPINAVVSTDWQSARAQADRADTLLARGSTLGPFHGVSMTVKDLLDVQGLESTAGSRRLAGHIAGDDAEVVRRLRAAGAIIAGKTNTATFGFDVQCASELFGRTNNPWNLERTPGGSSGGPAAALASGMVPLELGTDASGSLRIPAHCCGVAAHKPTYGLVSTAMPPLPVSENPPFALLSFGPMARSVADLSLAMSLLSDDWQTLPSAAVHGAGRRPRLGWAVDFLQPSGREVRALLERLAERAAADSMELVPLDPRAVEVASRTGELFGPLASIDPAAAESAGVLRQRERLAEEVDELLVGVDAWLLPVLPVPAPPHVDTSAPIDVDGEQRDYWQVFTANSFPFSVTGHPATSLPVGLASSGLPVGIQLVGRRRSDRRLLTIAAALENLVQFDSHPTS